MKRLLLVLALLSFAAPASAATPSPACLRSVSATADGAVYGAGSCTGDVVTLYRKAPSSTTFRTLTTAWKGYAVVDVADDGASTFVLLHCAAPETCRGTDPLVGRFAVAKLPHGGRPSAVTVLSEGGGYGAIAAAGGKWAAALSEASFRREPGDRADTVIEITGTAVPGRRAFVRPQDPQATPEQFVDYPDVALTASGPLVAYTASDSDTDPTAELRTATVSSTGTVTTSPYAPAAGATAGPPAVVSSGGRLFVAWSRGGRLALAHDGVRQDLPTRGQVVQVALAASGGRAFVLDAERFPYAGGETTRTYLRSVALDGTTTTSELSAAAGRREPQVRTSVNGVTAAKGRPTAAFFDGTRNVVVSP